MPNNRVLIKAMTRMVHWNLVVPSPDGQGVGEMQKIEVRTQFEAEGFGREWEKLFLCFIQK